MEKNGINIRLPEMPKIIDFAQVCEDPEWVLKQYTNALLVWQKVCMDLSQSIKLMAEKT